MRIRCAVIAAVAVLAVMASATAKDLGLSAKTARTALNEVSFEVTRTNAGLKVWTGKTSQAIFELAGTDKALTRLEYVGQFVAGNPANIAHALYVSHLLDLVWPGADAVNGRLLTAVFNDFGKVKEQVFGRDGVEVTMTYSNSAGLFTFTIDGEPKKND
jgi:hypothetical protein